MASAPRSYRGRARPLQAGDGYDSRRIACQKYFFENKDVDRALDTLELSFRIVEKIVPGIFLPHLQLLGITQNAEDAIADLNARFDQHHLGYRYQASQIVRLDSQFLHAEVAEGALVLLHDKGFEGAEQEFRSAHGHLRHGRTKEATVDALKAFESTLKAICAARKWSYKGSATAKELIALVLSKGLIPGYLETELAALRSLLESSVPTVRNKTSAHGQGATYVPMPEYLAAFALHSAATNIVLLVEAFKG